MHLLRDYSFTQSNQLEFARLSGDWNPIHMDPVFARRTIYGQVVHGMHIFLVALDTYLKDPANPTPSKVYVSFLSPLNLNQSISVEIGYRDQETLLEVKNNGQTVTFIRLTIDTELKPFEIENLKNIDFKVDSDVPHERIFGDLKNVSCKIDFFGNTKNVKDSFQWCVQRLGVARVKGLMGLSKFVGMEYPGLHSLFAGFELCFSQPNSETLHFRTERYSIPRAPVKFSFSGVGLEGSLDAFLRPPPYRQDDISAISHLVTQAEFSDQRALIIGGSRGLGELAAKVIASGGGRVDITYALGELDAQNVSHQINELKVGVCSAHRLNFKEAYEDRLKILIDRLRPTHIYYFASPQIKANKALKIDKQLYDEYMTFYAKIFGYLCQLVSKRADVRVFYPSTVYICQNDQTFREYIAAKRAGEKLCEKFNARSERSQFIWKRLPKLQTDQTQSFILEPGIQATGILLDIIRKF
jgi:hypothetical protein